MSRRWLSVGAMVLAGAGSTGVRADDTPGEARALGTVEQQGARGGRGVPVLVAFAQHPSPVVREAVARTLGGLAAGAAHAQVAARLVALADDPDPIVASVAVHALILERGARGARALRAACDADAHRAQRLAPVVAHAAQELVQRELDRLIPADGWLVGTYPGMFEAIEPLGPWATLPLVDAFYSGRQKRITPRQQLAGEALSALPDVRALADLQAIHARASYDRRWREVRELAAVALSRQPVPDPAPVRQIETEYRNREGRMFWRFAGEASFRLGMLYLRLDRTAEARDAFETAAAGGNTGRLHHIRYNLACIYAMVGRTDLALENLGLALDAGFDSPGWIARDRRLDGIRQDPRFAAIAAREPGAREPDSGED